MKKNNSNNLYNNEQRFALDIRLSAIVDIKKNNLNNLHNNEQRFARTSPLRGPC